MYEKNEWEFVSERVWWELLNVFVCAAIRMNTGCPVPITPAMSRCLNCSYRPTLGHTQQWTSDSLLLCVSVRHIVCVNIEPALRGAWMSLSGPRALLSHVATDSGCGLLTTLSIIECYYASVQFPATPYCAIRQVRLACHCSLSHICVSFHLFCHLIVGSLGFILMK